MKKTKLIILFVALFSISCSEDKFFKEKFDENITFNNKSSETIKSLKMWGGSKIDSPNSKIWNWENLSPNDSIVVKFNIKRDIGEPEGSIYYHAIFNNNDTLKGGNYYTNWQIFGGEDVIIHKDRFEIIFNAN